MESNSRKTKRSKIIFLIKNSSDCYVFMFLRKSEESDEELLHHRTTLTLKKRNFSVKVFDKTTVGLV